MAAVESIFNRVRCCRESLFMSIGKDYATAISIHLMRLPLYLKKKVTDVCVNHGFFLYGCFVNGVFWFEKMLIYS